MHQKLELGHLNSPLPFHLDKVMEINQMMKFSVCLFFIDLKKISTYFDLLAELSILAMESQNWKPPPVLTSAPERVWKKE